MIGYADVSFKYKKLYHNDEDTGFSIVKVEEKYPSDNLYRVRWPDGVLSEDFYNIAWAKQNCAKVYLEVQNTALGHGSGCV